MAAVALLCLVAFSALVVDYGVLWAARSQAQTSADAGALAGAQSVGRGMPAATSRLTASNVARESPVWGETTSPADVIVSNLPHPCPASAGGGNSCIRVDVMRGAQDDAAVPHTNTLPVFFATMLGINDQGVRATATAQAAGANSINCVKPWAVADKWIDSSGPTPWDQWDAWEPAAGDVYRAPLKPETNPTGFSLANDRGMQMALKAGTVGTWSAGWTQELDFGCLGSDCYREAIATCPSWIPTVGLWAGQRCESPGDHNPNLDASPQRQACRKDRLAWASMTCSPSTRGLSGTPAPGLCRRPTPKVRASVPIVIFHTNDYAASGCSGTNCVVKVVNVMGFFVEGMCDAVAAQGRLDPTTYCDEPSKTVVGRLVAPCRPVSRRAGGKLAWRGVPTDLQIGQVGQRSR